MDRNKDGQLDAEEAKRMPSSFRSTLEKSGVSLDRGVSKDIFMREIPKAYDQMRQDRERDEERRREEYRRREEEQRRSEDRNRESSSSRKSAPKPPAPYVPQKKVAITIDIPRRFEDGDTDGDGQIGYYEWRTWRPEERAQFKVYDKNGDGFLTPRELIKPPTSAELIAAASGTPAGAETPAPASISGAPSAERGDRNFSRGGGSSRRGPSSRRDESPQATLVVPSNSVAPVEITVSGADQEDADTRTARLFFSQMDSDKNKQITSEEWARSRRVKPKFEEAGIDVTGTMDEQQFIAAYKKAYAE